MSSMATFASPMSIASPRRRIAYSRSACSQRLPSSGSTPRGPTSSTRKGTASIRKPETPSASQKPTIFAISSRTAGLAMFRSGWKGAKLWW